MKQKTSFALLFLLVAAAIAITADSTSAVYSYELNWWTLDSGGGMVSGGDYVLQATIGQPDTGILSGGDFVLEGGFWAGVWAMIRQIFTYLPIVVK